MKIKPLANNILIEPIVKEAKSESGFIIPEASVEKTTQGRVIAVGEDVKKVKENDSVLFLRYGPTELIIDKKTYLVAKESDIFAIIE